MKLAKDRHASVKMNWLDTLRFDISIVNVLCILLHSRPLFNKNTKLNVVYFETIYCCKQHLDRPLLVIISN